MEGFVVLVGGFVLAGAVALWATASGWSVWARTSRRSMASWRQHVSLAGLVGLTTAVVWNVLHLGFALVGLRFVLDDRIDVMPFAVLLSGAVLVTGLLGDRPVRLVVFLGAASIATVWYLCGDWIFMH
jgi:hypothetical protein